MDHKKILTKFQYDLLKTFFTTEADSSRFFLTGGTALSAFYLGHRYSDDIDLFTLEEFHPTRIVSLAKSLAKKLNTSIEIGRASQTYHQFFLQQPDGSQLKVEFVVDTVKQFGNKNVVESIIVDSALNIASNKICAIYSRREVKDFVDLYFLLNESKLNLKTLIEHAKEKDGGITTFYLAGMFMESRFLKDMPRMIKPLELVKLQRFFKKLADNLLDQIKPEE